MLVRVTLSCLMFYIKDPGRYRDRDRRHRRTVLSSSWRYPSPWSVSSFFLISSSPAAFYHKLVSDIRMQAFGVSKTKPAFHLTQFTRPATYRNVCAFSSLIPCCIRVTLHAPDAWQMKKNFSHHSRASSGAFPQAPLYNVTTGPSKSSHQHQRHHYLRYPRSSKSSLGPRARLVPRTCLARDSARNRQNPYQRECVYESSARHCGGYHAVARLSS